MNFTVKQARQHAGKTQASMAEQMGLHRHTYMKLEENPDRLTVLQARQISIITGIPLDAIIFDTDSTESR